MVVLAVLGVIAAIAVPSLLDHMPRYHLDQAVHSVLAELRTAHMLAVSEGHPVDLLLDTFGKTLTLLIDRNEDGVVDPGEEIVLNFGRYPELEALANCVGGTFRPGGAFTCSEGVWKIMLTCGGTDLRYVYVFRTGQVQQSDEVL